MVVSLYFYLRVFYDFLVKRITKVWCYVPFCKFPALLFYNLGWWWAAGESLFWEVFFSVGAMSMTARMNHRGVTFKIVDEGRVNSIQKHHKTLIRLLRNNFMPKIGLMVGLLACIAKVNMIFL